MRRSLLPGLVLLAVSGAAAVSDAQQSSADPAARGLDVFVHVPGRAAPGSSVPVQIEAFGFPTAITLTPLASATIEAAWDPEHLGPGITRSPPSVKATTDSAGRAHLDVAVPEGDERALSLLVGVRTGSHERTRRISIKRSAAHTLALHVADTRVVPGSMVSAWVVVTQAATGEPAATTPVELALLEGGQPRSSVKLVTDAAGTAMARMPIPLIDEPAWTFTLRARSLARGELGAGESTRRLTLREETPGTPKIAGGFDEGNVLAGDRAKFTIRVRDATDQPIAGLPVRWWIGPKGTQPPNDEDWDKRTTLVKTDAQGEIHGGADAPTLVIAGVGTTLKLVAKTAVEGHALSRSASVSVGVPTSSAELLPEAGSIIPGVEQHMLLRVYDGRGNPVAASFSIEADGLSTRVTTGAEGDGEITWKPPVDVGARRDVGPCAGGVAAAVVVRPVGSVPALAPRREPFELCVPVDRDASAIVRPDRPIARSGEKVRVRVFEAPRDEARAPKDRAKRAWSVVLRSGKGEQAASLWIEDGEQGAEMEIPSGEPGAWSFSGSAPSTQHAATRAGGGILITPRLLPKLEGKVAGGRAAPGGIIDVDASLTDGKGHGIPGTVAAVVVDLHGGGSTTGLEMVDARQSICRALGAYDDRCDRFVEGDPALDGLRRGLLGGTGRSPLVAASDPGGTARVELLKTFGEVLRSLEGAVFEATESADRLRDVRRKGPRGFAWNPELMTLVTAAMDPAPRTPGGEKLTLADLMSVDPQVTFDNVARRVTRLKLFRILAAVRSYRRDQNLDPDEPRLRDPNALLRKLVRESRIAKDLLLDPWGGTIRFVPQGGPGLPFLSVVRGFALHAPGPDGRAGSGDDVKDPFERVLRSGTAYAKAVQEDRLVDAKYDMEVSEATVNAWQRVLEELTGTALGNAGGLGLSGVGEGGGGQGFGSGHGRLGGRGRASYGTTTGVYWWSPPTRTDASGRVRFHVPLGDAETTWRVALIGVPDGARQATTHVDVPVALPLSARVDAGASWIEGDRVEAAITLRNRTAQPIEASLAIAASGVVSLASASDATRRASVPAGGAAVVRVPVVAGAPGAAALAVTVRAGGLPEDVVRHAWDVKPAGELTNLTRAQWVEGTATLAVPVGDAKDAVPPMRLMGKPRLVLERGIARPLAAALEAMHPDGLGSRASLLDALEVAARMHRWAVAEEGEESAMAKRAAAIGRFARGRLAQFPGGRVSDWLVTMRKRPWLAADDPARKRRPECPRDRSHDDDLATLEAEPAPEAGSALACWDALASSAMSRVDGAGDPVSLSRALLAVVERPHRAALAATLADRLREQVALRPSGAITLPEAHAKSRASRAVVYAALLRAARVGKPSAAPAARLMAWVSVQRDADGGYGSPLATRSVVRALLAAAAEDKGPTRVRITSGKEPREVEVPPNARVEVPLDLAAVSVDVEVTGAGLLARLERPALRPWKRPAEGADSPLSLDVAWPMNAKAGRTGVVSVSVRHSRGKKTTADVRVPLPPGVALAAPVRDVRQVQGAILVRRGLAPSGLPVSIELPVRFSLAGRVIVPEASAAVAHEDAPRALAPARPFVIQ